MIAKHQSIVTDYLNGATTRELCLKHGYCLNNRHSILNILKKYDVPIRMDNKTHAKKYSINENYFENIDTEFKAYILGFIFADGNISKNTLRIQIAEVDLEILKKFKLEMGSTQSIKYAYSNIPNRQNMVVLDIHNIKIVKDLEKLGVFRAKTHKLSKLPEISDNLIRHFIRGYFDGDGCITSSIYLKYTRFAFSIVGTENFVSNIQNVMIEKLNLSKTKLNVRHKGRENNIRTLVYSGNNQIKLIFNYLYKDANIYLDRKFYKFKGVFNQ